MIGAVDIKYMLKEETLMEIFKMFDIDGGGSITADEIKSILGAGMNNISDKEFQMILDDADEDGNGEIEFDEFKHMVLKIFNCA